MVPFGATDSNKIQIESARLGTIEAASSRVYTPAAEILSSISPDRDYTGNSDRYSVL